MAMDLRKSMDHFYWPVIHQLKRTISFNTFTVYARSVSVLTPF